MGIPACALVTLLGTNEEARFDKRNNKTMSIHKVLHISLRWRLVPELPCKRRETYGLFMTAVRGSASIHLQIYCPAAVNIWIVFVLFNPSDTFRLEGAPQTLNHSG